MFKKLMFAVVPVLMLAGTTFADDALTIDASTITDAVNVMRAMSVGIRIGRSDLDRNMMDLLYESWTAENILSNTSGHKRSPTHVKHIASG